VLKRVLWTIVVIILGACSSGTAELPTLAVLPSVTPVPQATALPPTATETNVPQRPTLPPTFTPTSPPTATALPPTAIPTATLQAFATSALGLPAANPENYPITVALRGGGYRLDLEPPPAVSYLLDEGVHRLALLYTGDDYKVLTVQFEVLAGVPAGDYTPVYCDGPGNTLPEGAPICLSVTYNQGPLVASGPAADSTITLTTLSPLDAVIRASLQGAILPERSGGQLNPNAPASIEIRVAGQQPTGFLD
jgi:hypothetical protein